MVKPQEVLEILEYTLQNSGKFPDDASYLLREADQENDDAAHTLPLVQLQITGEEQLNPSNTDYTGFVEDDNGHRVGKIYQREYTLSIQADLWTVDHIGYDANELGDYLKDALYEHDSFGMEQPFRAESGSLVDEIWKFELQDGDRADDVVQTPTLRRWRQNMQVWAYEEYTTVEDDIDVVSPPTSGQFNDSDDDGIIENT